MHFGLQPTLENELIRIEPLRRSDFETLYHIAADPLIWEQHPNKNRHKRAVFEIFFEGAIESMGAFLVYNNQRNIAIGTSRYYELEPEKSSVAIGYTFLSRDHWGNLYNRALKVLMINYAFQFVDNVVLHVGVENIRSQKAVEKLGARRIGVREKAAYNEETVVNYIYHIQKQRWQSAQATPAEYKK